MLSCKRRAISGTNMIHLVLFGIQNRTFDPFWQPIIGSSFHLCAAVLLVQAALAALRGAGEGHEACLTAVVRLSLDRLDQTFGRAPREVCRAVGASNPNPKHSGPREVCRAVSIIALATS
jgi:hypothetical protein